MMTVYEQHLIDLFSQLVETFEEYEHVMRVRAFPDFCREAGRLDEDDSQLQIDLNILALKICNLIEEIEITFNIEEQLENVEKFSKKIQSIIDISVTLKRETCLAKEENTVTDKEIQSYNNVIYNLTHLDKIIRCYNSNFKNKLITLEQARKHFNEDLDKWINSITSGAVHHESL